MTKELITNDGTLNIFYSGNMVLVESVTGNGLDYLPSLLYSAIGDFEPGVVLIRATNPHVPYLSEFTSTGIVLDKAELYYQGDYNSIKKLLYDYFDERYGIEPLNNPDFINCINSAHKTHSFRMDEVFSF